MSTIAGIREELRRKAAESFVELSGVNLDEDSRDLFKLLHIEDDVAKKTQFRALVKEAQQQAAACPAMKKPRREDEQELVPFPTNTQKKPLEMGKLAKQFGGVLDRGLTKQQLYNGLVKLAKKVGRPDLDKKEVPILGISASSGAGKTEFLKWIFNHCCTYLPKNNEMDNNNATILLQKINEAIPQDQQKLDNILVLFASFNQRSVYFNGEGPIVSTTVERLLRSFKGDIEMDDYTAWKKKRFEGFSSFQDIINYFSSIPGKGKTGFIFCVDELSKLRHGNETEYQELMDKLLLASQKYLVGGGFCAIIGAALSIYDFGEVILQLSGRAHEPIQFPDRKPEMVEAAKTFARHNTRIFMGAPCSHELDEFYLNVTTSILESSTQLRHWRRIMDLKNSTETRVTPPSISYVKPDAFTYDKIFLMVSQGLFDKSKWGALDKNQVEALMNDLGGSVVLKPEEGDIRVRMQELLVGQMVLPAWRLLEFACVENEKKRMFKYVQNWVLTETSKLFYTYCPAEVQKMWEIATMGVLDLRRAMIRACNDATGGNRMLPTLKEIVEGLGVEHNLSEDLLHAVSHPRAAGCKVTKHLADDARKESVYAEDTPCFFYSENDIEKGIEGVFKGGFDSFENRDGVCVLFQMKMYKEATPGQILDWLNKADERAKEVGLQVGSYVLQLFVTGAAEANISKYKAKWPKNSMVFGTKALKHLFEPFGHDIIERLVNLKSR